MKYRSLQVQRQGYSIKYGPPAHGYTISGKGDGGVAGFGTGGATVKLQANGEGTLRIYSVEAQIGGKLAQLGQRLINGAAKKVADQFLRILLG